MKHKINVLKDFQNTRFNKMWVNNTSQLVEPLGPLRMTPLFSGSFLSSDVTENPLLKPMIHWSSVTGPPTIRARAKSRG